jgi:hypothetical protein
VFNHLYLCTHQLTTNDASSLHPLPRYQRSSAPTDIHVASPAERDACHYHTTHHAVARLPIHRVASPAAYADTNDRRQCLPIHHCVRTYRHVACHTCRYITSSQDISQSTHIFTTQSTTMVERTCGCVPCVACKRMFKGDRGLSLHANRTGCGYRWFQLDGTTYDTRWNEMMQTLPCSCAMK